MSTLSTIQVAGSSSYTKSDTDNTTEHAYTEESTTTEIDVEAEPETLPWGEITIPDGYSLTRQGVTLEDHFLSGPVWVAAATRDGQNDAWGLLLRWLDLDGNSHELAVPRGRLHEQGTTLAQDLAASGLMIVPSQERKLITYLGLYEPEKRLRSVSRLGWADDTHDHLLYVLPGEVIARNQAPDIRYQPERYSPSTYTLRRNRSLEEWREDVAYPCQGNPILVFALCSAFSGPLLKPAGLDGGGFHIYGGSSRGKTTALQVAASVWGCGTDPAEDSGQTAIHRWNATRNGLEGIAASHNDGLLALDELGSCDADDFGRIIYDLAGGKGKAAMDANRMLKAPRTWRTLILSTGEVSAESKIRESRRAPKAGQLLRLMDIPISGGVIVETHGKVPAQFANDLKRACGRTYGTAGPIFLETLAKAYTDHITLRIQIQALLDRYTQELTPSQAPPEQQRAIKRFALTRIAGELAQDARVLPDSLDIGSAIGNVRDAWIADAANLPEGARAIQAIRSFILANPHRLREDVNSSRDGQHSRSLAGYIAHERQMYLFTDEGFKEACGGLDRDTACKALLEAGLLFMNEGRRYKSKHSVWIEGEPQRLRLYAVRWDILEDETD